MRTVGRFVLDAAVRLLLLAASSWVGGWLILDVLTSSEDANIGGGIMVMLLVTGVGALVAAWDGHREGLPRPLLLWTAVALLASVASAVWLNVIEPETADRTALMRDLTDPFWALWIAVPAYCGVLVGSWIRRTEPAARRPAPSADERHPGRSGDRGV